ncbi:MAG: glycosyltransferase [Candidatus Hydrogenedens sp.]|nr:glycosyltransferase [Candidatus Hydrogenedens sp.]
MAYLTNQYPSVSHTFIRREIRALEARGYTVHRVAIRPGGAVADPEDQEEAARTHQVLAQSKASILMAAIAEGLRAPLRMGRAKLAMFQMAKLSERGLLRHMAYLVEAAYLVRWLRARGVQHVHVHFGTNAAAVARMMTLLGGPGYSMTVHGPDEFDQAIGLSLGAKVEDSRFTVAITDYCGSQLRRWARYPYWEKIQQVHCTVGPEWFEESPIAEDAQSLVCVGRLSEQKGQLLLLEAFARVARDDARRRLVLVGDGAMRGEIERLRHELGLDEQVVITGWQSEEQVRGHLRGCRALVLGSFAEGLPVVIMEALAMGRPVIATRIMGIPELVREGENGWLVAPGNTEELAEAMRAAFACSADELNARGARGRERVRERHSADTEAAKLDALFRERVGTPDV